MPADLIRPERTRLIRLGAGKLLYAMGFACLEEVTLANGRRADVMGIDSKGALAIVEIKSCLEDFAVDAKWQDYMPFCDQFYFAVDPDFPQEIIPEDVGLLIADGYGGAVLRAAPANPLAPARRKALTLHFARLAAFRLHGARNGVAAEADLTLIL